MSDLVERLRKNPLWPNGAVQSLTKEAAARITELEAQIAGKSETHVWVTKNLFAAMVRVGFDDINPDSLMYKELIEAAENGDV